VPVTLTIELSAVVIAIKNNEAMVLCLTLPNGDIALPSGPFRPEDHRTFDLAVRAFVTEQTGFSAGYVEQLYSFGDEGRQGLSSLRPDDETRRVISLGYLALTSDSAFQSGLPAEWRPYSAFFPWEDWRRGEPAAAAALRQALKHWCDTTPDARIAEERRVRVETLFPEDPDLWNEERVLDRYELLYSACLIVEARCNAAAADSGKAMLSDHRRILATGLSRLRGKLKYRPVIFELMPERFTLLELQRSLEAISGLTLHKQNFRRALERTGSVRPTGMMKEDTGGRPAELYAFDRERFRFSPSLGLSLPRG